MQGQPSSSDSSSSRDRPSEAKPSLPAPSSSPAPAGQVASWFERFKSFLPITLPRGRALVIRIILLLVGYGIFVGILVALYRYFQAYFQEPGLALYAYGGVFVLTMLTSATVVIPAFSALPLAVAVATTFDPTWVALAMALGGTIGETTAYVVGYLGGGKMARTRPPGYVRAERWMRRYGVWAVLLVSAVPVLIYDLIGIAAGVLRLPLWKFWLFTFAGRFPRHMVEIYTGGKILQLISGFFN